MSKDAYVMLIAIVLNTIIDINLPRYTLEDINSKISVLLYTITRVHVLYSVLQILFQWLLNIQAGATTNIV